MKAIAVMRATKDASLDVLVAPLFAAAAVRLVDLTADVSKRCPLPIVVPVPSRDIHRRGPAPGESSCKNREARPGSHAGRAWMSRRMRAILIVAAFLPGKDGLWAGHPW